MRYILGVVLGAALFVLPGVPAFTSWEDANDKPPLFDLYCDVDYWQGSAQCPSSKTVMWIGIGALVGFLGASVGRSSAIQPETKTQGSRDSGSLSEQSFYEAEAMRNAEENSVLSLPTVVVLSITLVVAILMAGVSIYWNIAAVAVPVVIVCLRLIKARRAWKHHTETRIV